MCSDAHSITLKKMPRLNYILLKESYIYSILNYMHLPLNYRCVYAVKIVICFKTGLDWRNLRFGVNPKKRKTT